MTDRNTQTFLTEVIQAVQAKLIADHLFAPEMIFFSDDETQGIPPPTDQYCVIVPGIQRPDQPVIAGAAPTTLTPVNGTLAVIYWWRLSVDVEYRYDAGFNDRLLGGLEYQRRIVRSLQLYDPIDTTSGGFLLEEPMRLSDAGFNIRPRKTQIGWAGMGSGWEVKYLADMVSIVTL
jgi:hypothetical protein